MCSNCASPTPSTTVPSTHEKKKTPETRVNGEGLWPLWQWPCPGKVFCSHSSATSKKGRTPSAISPVGVGRDRRKFLQAFADRRATALWAFFALLAPEAPLMYPHMPAFTFPVVTDFSCAFHDSRARAHLNDVRRHVHLVALDEAPVHPYQERHRCREHPQQSLGQHGDVNVAPAQGVQHEGQHLSRARPGQAAGGLRMRT